MKKLKVKKPYSGSAIPEHLRDSYTEEMCLVAAISLIDKALTDNRRPDRREADEKRLVSLRAQLAKMRNTR